MKKLLTTLLICVLCVTTLSCAVVRDPISGQIVFAGWGIVEFEHELDGEYYYFKRSIDTKETLVEMASLAVALGAALILFL